MNGEMWWCCWVGRAAVQPARYVLTGVLGSTLRAACRCGIASLAAARAQLWFIASACAYVRYDNALRAVIARAVAGFRIARVACHV